jgi:hypothetical protein
MPKVSLSHGPRTAIGQIEASLRDTSVTTSRGETTLGVKVKNKARGARTVELRIPVAMRRDPKVAVVLADPNVISPRLGMYAKAQLSKATIDSYGLDVRELEAAINKAFAGQSTFSLVSIEVD